MASKEQLMEILSGFSADEIEAMIEEFRPAFAIKPKGMITLSLKDMRQLRFCRREKRWILSGSFLIVDDDDRINALLDSVNDGARIDTVVEWTREEPNDLKLWNKGKLNKYESDIVARWTAEAKAKAKAEAEAKNR